MSVELINFKEKNIVYANHNGLAGDELIINLKKAKELIIKNGKDSLTLANFTNANLSNDVVNFLKSDEMKEVIPYIKKEAIVGITGIKKMVLNLYQKISGSGAKVFNTEEEAKIFLVSD